MSTSLAAIALRSARLNSGCFTASRSTSRTNSLRLLYPKSSHVASTSERNVSVIRMLTVVFLGRRTGFGHATVLKLCSNNSYAKSDVSRNFATAPSFHADCGGRSVRQAGLIDQPFQASICLRKSISTEPSVCIYFNEGRCACNVCICTKYLRVPSATGPLGRPSKPDVRAQRHRKQSD